MKLAATAEVAALRGRISFRLRGDRFNGLHPRTAEFEVSGYPVMERFLQAREHIELTTEIDLAARKVAGAIAVIVDEQETCDDLLARAIQAPSTSW